MFVVNSLTTLLIDVMSDLPLFKSTDSKILPAGMRSVGTLIWYEKVNWSILDVTVNVPLYTTGLAPYIVT